MTVSSLYKKTSATESTHLGARDGRELPRREGSSQEQLQGNRQQGSSIICRLGTVNLNDV